MGKSAFIKLVAFFISVTLLGFFIGFNYSVKTSKQYNWGSLKASPVLQDDRMRIK